MSGDKESSPRRPAMYRDMAMEQRQVLDRAAMLANAKESEEKRCAAAIKAVEEELGIQLMSWQRDIVEAVIIGGRKGVPDDRQSGRSITLRAALMVHERMYPDQIRRWIR